MENLVIEVAMPTLKSDIKSLASMAMCTEVQPAFEGLDAPVAQDLKLWWALYLIKESRDEEAVSFIDTIVLSPEVELFPILHQGWLWLTRMVLFMRERDYQPALGAAENALSVLADFTNKRNEDFLGIVASLLYCLAMLHKETNENSRAVKELTKAQKLFERLVKRDNARFSAMLVRAGEASTVIFKSRAKQMEVFAHYQNMTEIYTAMLNEDNGDRTREALENLVESLGFEGDLMLQMGNARNAVKFYTKALRYRMKISKEMGQKELDLSIGLARALLRLANRRTAAEQLLNSLRPLARRLGDKAALQEIERLLNSRTRNFNIMTLLKSL